jgi:uncharacterized protein (DUF305 family)
MDPRLIATSTLLLIATGCAAETKSVEEVPQEVSQALYGHENTDGGATCRGRAYPVWKDKRSPQVPQDDVELIDTLVPHHRAAVNMAEMELSRGDSAELKTMAEKMRSSQSDEIATMLRIREEITGCSTVNRFPDPHMQRDMNMMMEQSGHALDLMFIDDMIPHHASALSFTHNALPNLENAELAGLAHNVIDTQSMEIGDLHQLKQQLQ